MSYSKPRLVAPAIKSEKKGGGTAAGVGRVSSLLWGLRDSFMLRSLWRFSHSRLTKHLDSELAPLEALRKA